MRCFSVSLCRKSRRTLELPMYGKSWLAPGVPTVESPDVSRESRRRSEFLIAPRCLFSGYISFTRPGLWLFRLSLHSRRPRLSSRRPHLPRAAAVLPRATTRSSSRRRALPMAPACRRFWLPSLPVVLSGVLLALSTTAHTSIFVSSVVWW